MERSATPISAHGDNSTAVWMAFRSSRTLPGQAAACRYRSAPALSVNWGPWAEVGLAAAEARRGERLALQGIGGLTRAQGVQALARLMSQPLAQAAVVALNLRQWREFHLAAADAPLLSDLVRDELGQVEPVRDASPILQALRAADSAQRRTLLDGHVREQVAQVMRLDPAEIDPRIPFGNLGLDDYGKWRVLYLPSGS